MNPVNPPPDNASQEVSPRGGTSLASQCDSPLSAPVRDIRAEVLEALHRSGYSCLETIDVQVADENLVCLSGSVPSYYMKQRAQETVLHFVPGCRVQNNLTVVPEQRLPSYCWLP